MRLPTRLKTRLFPKGHAGGTVGLPMPVLMRIGICFAEPDTFFVFEDYFGVFGEGTHLAMPKTISAPDTSSLKPGSGATEGVLD